MSGQEAQDLAAQAEAALKAQGFDPEAVVRVIAPMMLGLPVCRECGCTDITACDGGCYWVEEDLCSACVGQND